MVARCAGFGGCRRALVRGYQTDGRLRRNGWRNVPSRSGMDVVGAQVARCLRGFPKLGIFPDSAKVGAVLLDIVGGLWHS
ncbi:MAG: hypothetical protein D6725_04550 [Planctomycetota bacterium]|nr:MAG: hypothetical protein D6725_04550 [Planctomycetota bacterium]